MGGSNRILDRDIQRKVELMQIRGMDVSLDGAYNRYAVTNRAGSVTLSPRSLNQQILDWLFAYEKGWDAGKARGYEIAAMPPAQGGLGADITKLREQ